MCDLYSAHKLPFLTPAGEPQVFIEAWHIFDFFLMAKAWSTEPKQGFPAPALPFASRQAKRPGREINTRRFTPWIAMASLGW